MVSFLIRMSETACIPMLQQAAAKMVMVFFWDQTAAGCLCGSLVFYQSRTFDGSTWACASAMQGSDEKPF